MQTIDIGAIPNQTFSTTLDNNRYDFAIYLANGSMCYDISINEASTVNGLRITNGSFLVPYPAYQSVNGNFLLLTNPGDLPDYTKFGLTQMLIYMTLAEIEAAVTAAGPLPPPPVFAYTVA